MPRPYSEDLRWRAIWMKEMLGFQVDEVAAALWMSPRTIERYVSKVLNSGDVKAGIIGRPANSVAMHQHVEFLIMEAVLEHPKKTLSEIVYSVYAQTGSESKVKNWIRENDAAWQFCQDPELMVEEAFLHVTDEEVKNYIHHAEYF